MFQIKPSGFLKKKKTGNKNLQKPLKRGAVFEKTDWFSMKPRGFSIKPSDFLFFFHDFYTILHFDKVCRTHCFEFLNFILIKNLKMDSNFFRIFYFKKFKFPNLSGRFLKN
jgi:hypothetical protein